MCTVYTRGLKHGAACGPRGLFVGLLTLFGDFQIISIYVAKYLEKDSAK